MPVALRYADMTNGSQMTNVYPLPINCASSGDNILITGVNDKQTLNFRIFFTVAGATIITFKDGSTNLTGAMTFTAGGAMALDISGMPWFQMTRGNSFILNSSNPVQISGAVYYQQKT